MCDSAYINKNIFYIMARGIKKTKESFIEDAKKIHGDKYDYSKVTYIDVNTPVCIICPKHGEFWQQPAEHLKNHGCHECGKGKRRKTTIDFIEDARKVHGEKYDYSKVEYVNNKTKVCIICPEHGEFLQAPVKHLMSGQGCSKCNKRGNIKKEGVNLVSFTDMTNYKKKFIENASIIHHNKYDYSKIEYTNCNTKVCIVCPEHGEFWQTPHHHLQGRGCPKCGRKEVDTNTFIELSKKKYGNKYSYENTIYVDRDTNVIITCPEHGNFEIRPRIFLNENVETHCPECAKKNLVNETKLYELIKRSFSNLEIIRGYRNYKILGRQEIDIYIPNYKIGIEYQGCQHFHPVCVFGGKKQFKKQEENDLKKIKICKNNGIKLFHFCYDYESHPLYNVYHDDTQLLEVIKKEMRED